MCPDDKIPEARSIRRRGSPGYTDRNIVAMQRHRSLHFLFTSTSTSRSTHGESGIWGWTEERERWGGGEGEKGRKVYSRHRVTCAFQSGAPRRCNTGELNWNVVRLDDLGRGKKIALAAICRSAGPAGRGGGVGWERRTRGTARENSRGYSRAER